MSRRYIQNCTGGMADEKNSSFLNFISRIIFDLLFAAFLSVSAYILFFSHFLEITEIQIEGSRELDGKGIREVLETRIHGKYFNFLPKNNFLLVSERSMKDLLLENFKKIKTAEVEKKFPQSLEVSIQERKALLVWCSKDECFLLDEDGDAYMRADFGSQEMIQNNLIKIEDMSLAAIDADENIIKPSFEQYALGIGKALEEFGYDVKQYRTPSRMAEEIDVATEQGTEFYFSSQFPLERAVGAFSVVLKKEIPKERKENIAYFDLRSENKVFYRFKGEESEDKKENKEGNDEQDR